MTHSKAIPSGVDVKIQYSPYFELEDFNQDTGLLVRVVITLGPERVPKGYIHKHPYADDLDFLYKNGIVEWVSEIYFINTSKKTLEITPLSLKSDSDNIEFEQKTTTIQPGKWLITTPLVGLHSTYGTEANVRGEYLLSGMKGVISGTAIRQTVQDIQRKYRKR